MPALAQLLAFPSRPKQRLAILPVEAAAPDLILTPPVPPPPKKPRRRRKPPVSLSDAQLLALLERAKAHRERDWVMILVTYWHGLRASETISLRERDFDLAEGTVKFVRGKGSDGGEQTLQEHENPLLNERAAIAAWLKDRGQFGVKGGAKRQVGRNHAHNSDSSVDSGRSRSVGVDHVSNHQAVEAALAANSAEGKQPAGGDQAHDQPAVPGYSDDDRGRAYAEGQNDDGDRLPVGHEKKITPSKTRQSNEIVRNLGGPTKVPPGDIWAWPPDKPAGGCKPSPDPSRAALEPPAPPQTPSDRLFPITRQHFWAIVHGYALAAGIPRRKCKTHMLKHTIAKHLVRAGHPLNEIQEWMGWSSIETMNWYTRADEEELGHRIGDSIRAKQGLRQVQQGSLFS
jgi:integrase